MLQSLHVHNFALIEDAKVDFDRGFTVFTGETGAGKSILVDAFGIALGGRAAAGMVRTGTDAFWVQAVFDVQDERISALLQEQGIEADDFLFLKRRVTAAGKKPEQCQRHPGAFGSVETIRRIAGGYSRAARKPTAAAVQSAKVLYRCLWRKAGRTGVGSISGKVRRI